MLVDDSYEQLLDRIDQLEAGQRDLLRQHFMLLAFDAQEVPEHAPVRVVALPSWSQVEQATQHIGKVRKGSPCSQKPGQDAPVFQA